MQTGYIYAITNNFNSDIYIGSTLRPVIERFNEHKASSRGSRRGVFHQFMADNGVENFTIVELKRVEVASLLELLSLEESYIRDFGTLNTTHGTNNVVSRDTFKKEGHKIMRKEPISLPSKDEIMKKASESTKMLTIDEFIDMFISEENNYRKHFSSNGLNYISPALFELFGYEGDFKTQRAAFLKFAKRKNIQPLELTSTSTEIEEFPEIQKEIQNEPKKGTLACRKWIVMTSRDIKTVMMKLGTKNGDMIRSYYVDLEELMALYTEYTMFFNLREAQQQAEINKNQEVAKLNQQMEQMRLSMEARHEQTVQKHEQALNMLSKMGVTLNDVKEQNEELIHQNDETNEKLDETVENLGVVMDRLNIAVEDRAPRLKRHGVRERFVLFKKNNNPEQRFQYYAIRGQANYVNGRLAKLKAERFPNLTVLVDILCQTNPRNLFLRFKERVDGLEEWNDFVYAGNDVGCPIEMEHEMIDIFRTLDDEKRDV